MTKVTGHNLLQVNNNFVTTETTTTPNRQQANITATTNPTQPNPTDRPTDTNRPTDESTNQQHHQLQQQQHNFLINKTYNVGRKEIVLRTFKYLTPVTVT